MDAKKGWNDIVCYKKSKLRPWGQMSITHEIYKLEQEKTQSLEIDIEFLKNHWCSKGQNI